MTKIQMKAIAERAAKLAVNSMSNEDKMEIMRFHNMTAYEYFYQEYMDQLQTGDDQCLKYWIGSQVEAGVKAAVQVLKMWIRARLQTEKERIQRRDAACLIAH